LYASAQDAKAYEDVMKAQVFDIVFAKYAELKKVYQRTPPGVKILASITEVQDSQAKRFLSPLVSFSIFRDYLANRQTTKENPPQRQGEGDEEKGAQKLLPLFLQERIRLRALRHLPVLVHFYKLLTTALSHRITEVQALELTVPQCIAALQDLEHKTRQKSNLTATLTKDWKEFKEAWSDIRDLLAELEGCPDQQRNRRFESYITLVDDNTIIGALISHPNITDQYDEILRVIDALLKLQSQMLMRRDHYEKWNAQSLLFEAKPTEINASHLPSDSDKQEMLITGNYEQQDFEHFILLQVWTLIFREISSNSIFVA